MRCWIRFSYAGLGLLVAVAACQDVPTAAHRTLEPGSAVTTLQPSNQALAELGELLFEDESLSVLGNQSCRTCHEPSQGFAGPASGVVTRGSVVQGSVARRFGERRPPTSAYATLTPNFSGGNNPSGGIFWDGRATGHLLGNPAADQALGPFLNPVEQALPDKACLVYRVVEQPEKYGNVHPVTWWDAISAIQFPTNTATVCSTPLSLGTHPGDHVALSPADRATVNTAYDNAALAIAAFEATLNRFSARVDGFGGGLSPLEDQGRRLFSGKGKCQQCHSNKGSEAAFTDFEFHNLGVPRNPDNPKYDSDPAWVDLGLGGFTGRDRHNGKFRTTTTRNVGVGENRTYMHNGALVSLLQVVDFYNTRDVLRTCAASENDPARWGSAVPNAYGCWPPPEFGANLDTKQMGKLGLDPTQVRAIVAYLCAMTDGWLVPYARSECTNP
jgi:cytochrome c peroxidase